MDTSNPFQLQNKNIIITGASSGIGRQCAISASQLGARVILVGRNMEKLCETLELMDHEMNHIICAADLMDYEITEREIKNLRSIPIQDQH